MFGGVCLFVFYFTSRISDRSRCLRVNPRVALAMGEYTSQAQSRPLRVVPMVYGNERHCAILYGRQQTGARGHRAQGPGGA